MIADTQGDAPPGEDAEDLYENAPCGYVSVRSDGVIIRANRTILSWLGYESREMVGVLKFYELLTVGGQVYFETHCAPLIRMQGAVREIALEMRRKDRSRVPVLINAALRIPREGMESVTRITIFDATDRRKYEQELLRSRIRAEEADQSKAAFIATVAHEIRNPLGAIMAAQHLLDRTQLSEHQTKLVGMLGSSARSMLTFLNDVLDISRLDAGGVQLATKPFLIRELLSDIVEALRARAVEKDLRLELHVSEDVPQALVGDPIRLRQVLTNLVTNGIKFTDRGHVQVRAQSAAGQVSSDHVSVIFSVSDSGIGIASEHLAAIFDPYKQLDSERKARYGSSGLGLAISKRLVESQGSRLEVVSELGKGSTFSFLLRLKRDPK